MRTGGPVGGGGDKPLYLWPELWPVWSLWRDLETQWNSGADGWATGLRYDAAQLLLRERVRARRRKEYLWLLQGMEEAALHAWAERRAQKR